MLLAAAPDQVKRDLVASRTLSCTGILFKFFTIFQPGGGMEKASLLKQISEPKVGSSVPDLLQGLRQWRRLLGRAAELRLTLPDPVVLATVLGRFADALGRVGVDRFRTGFHQLDRNFKWTAVQRWDQSMTTQRLFKFRLEMVLRVLQVPPMGLVPSHLVDFGKVMRGAEKVRLVPLLMNRNVDAAGCGSPAHMKKDCPHKPNGPPKTPKAAKIKSKDKDTPEKEKKPAVVSGQDAAKGINQGDVKTAEKGGEPMKGEPVRDAGHGQGGLSNP
eukprot:s3183_g5.t1